MVLCEKIQYRHRLSGVVQPSNNRFFFRRHLLFSPRRIRTQRITAGKAMDFSKNQEANILKFKILAFFFKSHQQTFKNNKHEEGFNFNYRLFQGRVPGNNEAGCGV